MKTRGILILSILVLICFGLLWSLTGPANNAQASQGNQLTGRENHQIDLMTAQRLIKNYQMNPGGQTIRGGFIGRDSFEKVLAQPGCIGIRYYYARNDDGSPTVVIFGVDAKGIDMENGVLLDAVKPCPPFCEPPH